IKSGLLLTWPKPALAATGNWVALSRRESKNVPFPCISRLATKAFQYVAEPKPVQVLRLTPARPNAGGISTAADFPSGRNPLPSSISSASHLHGPHPFKTLRTVATLVQSRSATGCRLGADETLALTVA